MTAEKRPERLLLSRRVPMRLLYGSCFADLQAHGNAAEQAPALRKASPSAYCLGAAGRCGRLLYHRCHIHRQEHVWHPAGRGAGMRISVNPDENLFPFNALSDRSVVWPYNLIRNDGDTKA